MVIRVKLRYLFITLAFFLIVLISPFAINEISINISSNKDALGGTKDGILVPIIMYHEIKTYKLGKDVIAPYEFENDLKYLQDNGYNTITLTQLIDYVYYDKPLPVNPIILSFDDGYLNTYAYALPLIKQYNMQIVLSIIGKSSDDFTETPSNNLDYSHVTWDQLREMVESGRVEAQNHTYNLHSYRKDRIGCAQGKTETLAQYEKVLTEDISALQVKIQTTTGTLPNTFTYPYGKYSDATLEIIKKLNFKAVLTCNYGVNVITKDTETLFSLKRICRSHNAPIKKILKEASKTVKG